MRSRARSSMVGSPDSVEFGGKSYYQGDPGLSSNSVRAMAVRKKTSVNRRKKYRIGRELTTHTVRLGHDATVNPDRQRNTAAQ